MCSLLQGGTLLQNKRHAKDSEESRNLETLIDKYLELADTASGFRRRSTPNRRLTVSTCIRCQRIAAARDPKLLAFVESLHVCPVGK
jgi:hypothetical protein